MWVEIVSEVALLFFKLTFFTIFCLKNYNLKLIFTAIIKSNRLNLLFSKEGVFVST